MKILLAFDLFLDTKMKDWLIILKHSKNLNTYY